MRSSGHPWRPLDEQGMRTTRTQMGRLNDTAQLAVGCVQSLL